MQPRAPHPVGQLQQHQSGRAATTMQSLSSYQEHLLQSWV
jgi:hypothetical protein